MRAKQITPSKAAVLRNQAVTPLRKQGWNKANLENHRQQNAS